MKRFMSYALFLLVVTGCHDISSVETTQEKPKAEEVEKTAEEKQAEEMKKMREIHEAALVLRVLGFL